MKSSRWRYLVNLHKYVCKEIAFHVQPFVGSTLSYISWRTHVRTYARTNERTNMLPSGIHRSATYERCKNWTDRWIDKVEKMIDRISAKLMERISSWSNVNLATEGQCKLRVIKSLTLENLMRYKNCRHDAGFSNSIATWRDFVENTGKSKNLEVKRRSTYRGGCRTLKQSQQSQQSWQTPTTTGSTNSADIDVSIYQEVGTPCKFSKSILRRCSRRYIAVVVPGSPRDRGPIPTKLEEFK